MYRELDMIELFLNKANKNVTKIQVQRLCGFLNFLTQAILPWCTFVRRLYSMAPEHLKQHHHVRIKAENWVDLQIWKTFLQHQSVFARPFIDAQVLTAQDIDMYSDA